MVKKKDIVRVGLNMLSERERKAYVRTKIDSIEMVEKYFFL